MAASPATPRIRPLVHLALGAETARLSGSIAFALAGEHPAALPFFGGAVLSRLDSSRRRDALVRQTLEACTDLGSREQAMLRGYEIDDAANVVLSLFLGDASDTEGIEGVLEAVHRIAGGFFDQTLVDVHALLFLPDLAAPETRRARYRSAYEQLSRIDDLASPERELGFRGRPSLDYRWIIDCRSSSGAHAGVLDEVLSPVALALAMLLHGENAAQILQLVSAADQLRGRVSGRVAGYSTLGLGLLQHDPVRAARAIGADAAVRHLLRYLRSESAVPAATFFGGYDVGPPTLADDGAEQILAAWTSEIQLDQRLRAVRSPSSADGEIGMDPVRQRRQDRYREQSIGSIGHSLLARVREWLVQHGAHDAERMLRALADDGEGQRSEADLVTEFSVDGLFRQYASELRIALNLDGLASRIEARQAQMSECAQELEKLKAEFREIGAVSAESSAGEIGSDEIAVRRAELERQLGENDAKRAEASREIAELEAECRRREQLLDRTVSCEVLERELRAIGDSFPSRAPDGPRRSPDPASAIPQSEDAESPPPRWWERLLGRRASRARETKASYTPATVSAPADVRPTPTSSQASEASSHDVRVTPCELVERLLWLRAYALVVHEVLDAVRTHAEDVRSASEYFAQTAEGLARRAIGSTKFRLAVLRKQDLLAEAAEHRAELSSALESRFGHERLAACCRLAPEPLAPLQHPLNVRLDGLDEAVTAAVDETLTHLMSESLADRCAHSQQIGHALPLAAYLRTLAEAAEPLARPQATFGESGALTVRRSAIGDADLQTLTTAEGNAPAIAHAAMEAWPALSRGTSLTFVTTTHGFPAHAIHKLLAIRAELDPDDRPMVPPSVDLWPPLGALGFEGRTLQWSLVLGAILCLVTSDDERGWVIQGTRFSGTAADVAYAIGHSAAHRHLERELQRAIEDALARPGALEKLRAAAARWGTAEAEVALEAIAALGRAGLAHGWEEVTRYDTDNGPPHAVEREPEQKGVSSERGDDLPLEERPHA